MKNKPDQSLSENEKKVVFHAAEEKNLSLFSKYNITL
jgi:hypothetical protein